MGKKAKAAALKGLNELALPKREKGKGEMPAVSSEPPSLPGLHVPVSDADLKHAVVGQHVHVHLHGIVKGVRAKDGNYRPNPEMEIEPSHSAVSPADGASNPYSQMADDDE